MSRLKELIELEAAATPGEWYNETHVIHAEDGNGGATHPATFTFRLENGELVGYADSVNNSEFICALRNAAPDLFEVVRAIGALLPAFWMLSKPEYNAHVRHRGQFKALVDAMEKFQTVKEAVAE